MDTFITVLQWIGWVIAAILVLSAFGHLSRISKATERLVELKEGELSFLAGIAHEAADQIEADNGE